MLRTTERHLKKWTLNNQNIARAEQLAHIIASLTEDPDSIFSFLREKGDQIKWD